MSNLHDGRARLTSVVRWRDAAVRFALDDARDEIQRFLYEGSFYEIDELEYHRTLIPRNGRVMDVGANVGNHSLFYAGCCGAQFVLAVEVNERPAELLRQAVEMNALLGVVEVHSGVALGGGEGWGVLDTTEADFNNLGGVRVVLQEEETADALRIVPGDQLVDGREIDFLKIDVEGSEMPVLAGLQATIDACRPVVALEVMPQSRPLLSEWCEANRYRVERTFQMYRGIFNHVVLPL